MMTLRQFGSRIEGHPTPDIPWVEAATGSLGQGLPIGVGDAISGKYLDELPFRTWVICGDSEMAEGSIWEAFELASHYELSNLVAIVDVNVWVSAAKPCSAGHGNLRAPRRSVRLERD